MAQLNPPQQKAVDTLRGPVLVLAGAGTGKTRVVTHRIANLLRHGTKPQKILAVTFTNKAALEMQGRVRQLLGKRVRDEKPQISTFHAHCLQILRRHIARLGYPAEFAIYDRGDQEALARKALREIRVPDKTLRPRDLLYKIGAWKTHGVRPRQAAALAAADDEHLAAAAYRRYQTALKLAGAVDFDDLLLCTEELFQSHPDVRGEEAGRFDHILVDEYQDTNGSQYRIIESLAREHRNLCVVGDDDQSIYGWRGAEVQHILNFRRDWPDAAIIHLLDNYRSTGAILEAANRLIAFNTKRHEKQLRAARGQGSKPRIDQYKDETAEAEGVVARIKQLISGPQVEPRDVAILFRTNEQPRPFEDALRRSRVPYVLIGGMSFYDRKEVKDVLSFLRLMVRPADETALRRIINKPPRGIGPTTEKLLIAAAVERGDSMWEVLQQPPPGLAQPALGHVQSFVKLLRQLQHDAQQVADRGGDWVEFAKGLLQQVKYRQEVDREYPQPEDRETRWNAVEEVVNGLGAYAERAKDPTLQGYLDAVALGDRDSRDDKENQLRQNSVALMTLHSAKGLEFPHVFMVGMEEGLLPHRRSVEVEGAAIDEERRLCYVGITRAQEQLTLSLTRTRMKWGKPRETVPSRFLYEMIGQADRVRTQRPASDQRGRRSSRPRK